MLCQADRYVESVKRCRTTLGVKPICLMSLHEVANNVEAALCKILGIFYGVDGCTHL